MHHVFINDFIVMCVYGTCDKKYRHTTKEAKYRSYKSSKNNAKFVAHQSKNKCGTIMRAQLIKLCD